MAFASRSLVVLLALSGSSCGDDLARSTAAGQRHPDATVALQDASSEDSGAFILRGDASPDARVVPDSGRLIPDAGPRFPLDGSFRGGSPFDGGVARRRGDAASPVDSGSDILDSGPGLEGGARPGLLRIPVAIHLRDTLLSDGQLLERLAEVQSIWAQADICFEMHLDDLGPDDAGTPFDTRSFSKIDVWLVQVISRFPMANGLYDGFTGAYVRDTPDLQPAPHPVTFPFARTFSHELGHVLGLEHYVGPEDTPDSLMSSKYMGHSLHDFEIAEARRVADVLALYDRTVTSCGPPRRGQVDRFVRGLPPWFPVITSGPE